MYLTRSWQHKQWLLDCRKQEFRELLSAISEAHIDFVVCSTLREKMGHAPWNKFLDAHKRALQIVVDRIYIAEDVKRLRVRERFGALGDAGNADTDTLLVTTRGLIDELAEVARRG